MVKKRGVGNRAYIYFDSIDLQILEFLDKPNRVTHEGGYPVLEVAEKLNINHKSLKPHIDKLLSLGLIETTYLNYAGNNAINPLPSNNGLTTPRQSFWFYNDAELYDDENDTRIEEDKKKAERFNNILKILQEIRGKFYKDNAKKEIYLDLRSKKTIKEFGKHLIKNKK